jgi:hypothetical protein
VSRRSLALCAVVLAACAATSAAAAPVPRTAVLTGVNLANNRAVFFFRTAPTTIKAGYVPRSQVVESGSGLPVKVAGSAFLVIRFSPASGAAYSTLYKLPSRLKLATTAGPVREAARISDFEGDLAWVIGVDRKRAYHVTRRGANVFVAVG